MSRVVLTLLAFVALLLGPASVAAAADDSAGAVYTLTNTAANAVIVYDRSASGALTWSGTFPTGGRGGSLGSQGAVVTSKDGRWLYAVDAGSNDIAVFRSDRPRWPLQRMTRRAPSTHSRTRRLMPSSSTTVPRPAHSRGRARSRRVGAAAASARRVRSSQARMAAGSTRSTPGAMTSRS